LGKHGCGELREVVARVLGANDVTPGELGRREDAIAACD